MDDINFFEALVGNLPKVPVKVSSRSFRSALEGALIRASTRRDLETVLAKELRPRTCHRDARAAAPSL